MADTARPPGVTRLPSLTGMRFLAALLVFAFHTTWQTRFVEGGAGDVLGDVFANAGFVGVTFFFVLSGFVLTWSARAADTVPGFYRRRLVKIVPNHLVTFLVAGVLMLIAADAFTTTGTLANLFLLQAWFPSIEVPNTMNAVSWSLSCELFFYLSFPLLLRLLDRLSARQLWVLAGGLAAAALIVPTISSHLVGGTPLPFIADGSLSFEQIWFVYFFPPVRALEFVLGMVAARLVLAGHWPRLTLLPAGLIAVAGYVAVSQAPYLFRIAGVTAIFLTPLVASAAQADDRGHASPFRGAALVRLGELSFAFYMVHGLVVTYGHRWLIAGTEPSAAVGFLELLGALAASLVLAYALLVLVEEPLMRRFGSPPGDRRRPLPQAVRPAVPEVRR